MGFISIYEKTCKSEKKNLDSNVTAAVGYGLLAFTSNPQKKLRDNYLQNFTSNIWTSFIKIHEKLFVKSEEETLDSNDMGAVRYGLLAFTSTCSPQKKL